MEQRFRPNGAAGGFGSVHPLGVGQAAGGGGGTAAGASVPARTAPTWADAPGAPVPKVEPRVRGTILASPRPPVGSFPTETVGRSRKRPAAAGVVPEAR